MIKTLKIARFDSVIILYIIFLMRDWNILKQFLELVTTTLADFLQIYYTELKRIPPHKTILPFK
jgi:hypothetical protein